MFIPMLVQCESNLQSCSYLLPDVVLFVNGLSLALIELKNPTAETATIWTAWEQLQTYRAELPTLFTFNELLVVSDGVEARLGVLEAGREWFNPWRTITGQDLCPPVGDPAAGPCLPELQPNASFIAFTGTPLEWTGRNTCAVFGDHISIYDIQRSVGDQATVPTYYESRLAKLDLLEDQKLKVDETFEEVTEGEEHLKTKWVQVGPVAASGRSP